MFRIMTVAALIAAFSGHVMACPFCSAVSQTFSEEMESMNVVVIAKLHKVAKLSKFETTNPQAEVPKSQFIVAHVIKGAEFIKVGDTFETIYFGEPKKDRPFLAMATEAPNMMWSTPLILTDRAEKYLKYVSALKPGAKRLEFFQEHLEDEDEMLARDAYDEFAKAPYKDVIALKDKMHRDKLLEFIQDKEVPSNRRRLYFTMLGVCGKAKDAELLERLMQSEDRKDKAGLDAMLACYMILTREAGLDRVDELFLKNKNSEYADTYAAIMAIRFHGSETDVIPRTRLVKSLRHMLDRPELADLVIPDLARWEDWEIMPKLIQLFVDADENSSWVRVPVVNYLRACPDPSAKAKIDELKKVDADAVKRAMLFFPLGMEKESEDSDKSKPEDKKSIETTGAASPDSDSTSSNTLTQPTPPTVTLDASATSKRMAASREPMEVAEVGDSLSSRDRLAVMPSIASSGMSVDSPDTLNQVEAVEEEASNLGLMLGVTFLSGGICFVAMRSILGVRRP